MVTFRTRGRWWWLGGSIATALVVSVAALLLRPMLEQAVRARIESVAMRHGVVARIGLVHVGVWPLLRLEGFDLDLGHGVRLHADSISATWPGRLRLGSAPFRSWVQGRSSMTSTYRQMAALSSSIASVRNLTSCVSTIPSRGRVNCCGANPVSTLVSNPASPRRTYRCQRSSKADQGSAAGLQPKPYDEVHCHNHRSARQPRAASAARRTRVPSIGATVRAACALCSANIACSSGRTQGVLVVQSPEHGSAANSSEVIEAMTRHRNRYHSNCWRIRHAGTEGHVWASAVVMFAPGSQRTPQMSFG